MGLTLQQQQVIDAVMNPSIDLIKIKAVAGAGKTFTLVEAAKEYKPKTGIYIAYNKAIADEATQKFKGTNIRCSTIHSLAYAATVRPYGLNVGYYGPRNVTMGTRKLSYRVKNEVVAHIKKFCLSDYLTPDDYIKDVKMDERVADIFEDQLNHMADGTMACPHDFYLKLYHVLMSNDTIPIPEVDMLLVDECGDINKLTLAVFNIIKANKKIAVGDPMQNIYSFNETVNAFDELKGKGLEINLTESFRVSENIAGNIEAFVKCHMDTTFEFKGNKNADTAITTSAYIARTNSGLLEEMFTLMANNEVFHVTRKIETILELPLVLANINSGNPITDYKYKHIEKARKEWETTKTLQISYKSADEYVRHQNRDDEEIKIATKVVSKHSPKELNALTKYVKENSYKECNHILSTAHSSKGLEFSSVTIAPDMNDKVAKTLTKIDEITEKPYRNSDKLIKELHEELRLYYVACSRAMSELHNAKMLEKQYVQVRW